KGPARWSRCFCGFTIPLRCFSSERVSAPRFTAGRREVREQVKVCGVIHPVRFNLVLAGVVFSACHPLKSPPADPLDDLNEIPLVVSTAKPSTMAVPERFDLSSTPARGLSRLPVPRAKIRPQLSPRPLRLADV